jgi:hypothetical protein
MTKIAGYGSKSGSGSISQRHGSADPDPYQNVMDPQHCNRVCSIGAPTIHEIIGPPIVAEFNKIKFDMRKFKPV